MNREIEQWADNHPRWVADHPGWAHDHGLSGMGDYGPSPGSIVSAVGSDIQNPVGLILGSDFTGIIDKLFGWGGPPIGSITDQIVPLRQHIADMRNALASAGMGAPDAFNSSPETDQWNSTPNMNSTMNNVVTEVTGDPNTDKGHKRDAYQNAITDMQQTISSLNMQLQAAELAIQTGHAVVTNPPPGTPATPIPPPGNGYHLPPPPQGYDGANENYYGGTWGYNGVQNQTAPSPVPATASTIDWTPWLLGGGGVILLIVFMKGRSNE